MEQGLNLFGKLTEKIPVFLISVGIFLFLGWALNGSTLGPVTLTVESTERLFMLIIATVLICIGLAIVIFENFQKTAEPPLPGSENLEIQQKHFYKTMMTQKDKIKTLTDKILDVQTLVANKDDEVSLEIRQILNGIDAAITEFQESVADAPLIVKWIEIRIDDWVNSLSRTNYPEFKKLKNGSFQKFKDEVSQLLHLFKNNVFEGINKDPGKVGINRHIDYPFLYRRALHSVQTSIYEELSSSGELNSRQQDELIDCMNELIEDIN